MNPSLPYKAMGKIGQSGVFSHDMAIGFWVSFSMKIVLRWKTDIVLYPFIEKGVGLIYIKSKKKIVKPTIFSQKEQKL